MIIIWCSGGYFKMLSPWQPSKWTFWLIHTLFLLKINLIQRKSLQVKIYKISFTVGISCGLTHGYRWIKVILTLHISMWFREKINPLSDGPQNWHTLGNRNVFEEELRRFRGTSQAWLVTESDLLFMTEHSQLVLGKVGHTGWDWLESWSSGNQLCCRFVTQHARLRVSKSLWSSILSLTGRSCISGGYGELQDSSVIQNLLGPV